MVAIERDNPRLKGVLPNEYARPALDKHRLGELIDLIGTISFTCSGAVPAPTSEDSTVTDRRYNKSKDILGRVYEYFLGQFACAEGKKGGQWSEATSTTNGSPEGEHISAHQFYTPQSVARLVVEMLAPLHSAIYLR